MALLKPTLCGLILATYWIQVFCGLDWESQRLNQFQKKYNNSRSDIIFLLDDSYSVSNFGFSVEKKFITSLLSQISVQPIASRIALISFSNDVRKNIDYIDYGQFDKNKCTFTKDFARVTHRKGWATNMRDGFSRAKKVLDDAKKNGHKRSNVNTVIVLLTDGWWNWGGNPKDLAASLRSSSEYHAEVISVGVDQARRSQLQEIAGSSSNVIFANDFSEFENLAARIRGDQIEKLYQPVYKPLCGKTCDDKATCSCGTISGIYQCACGPGYWGSGDFGKCAPCPFGRYKQFSSPDPCKLCPAFSSTTKEGSMSVADCQCFEGYKGNPGLGVPCKVAECPAFPSTIPNGNVQNCGNKYKETCTFVCNDYHQIAEETAQSKKVVCQKTGKWNVARTPTCVAITCPMLPIPPHAKVSCSGEKVNSKCTFECYSGYRRNGTNSRTCRPDGQWSGEQPKCNVIQCASLKRGDNIIITPSRCINSKTNFNDGCAYRCKSGFTQTKGSASRKCLADGTWSDEELVCEDTTPPTITCPANVVLDTDKDEATKEIEFEMPSVIDNSEALAQTKITLEQYPSVIKSPHKFPIGVTRITFTARDEAGNQDSCTYRVEVQDRQPPVINCPGSIEKTVLVPGATNMSISWTAPTFKDNSGTATMESTHDSPHVFNINNIHPVKYTVSDNSKNTATCTIHIKINGAQCPARNAPINGALPCRYIPFIGDFCQMQCMDPHKENGPKAPYYICQPSKKWFAPYPYSSQWPDCTDVQSKEGMSQKIEMNYYSGSCHESISGQTQIRSNFKKLLDRFLIVNGMGDCNRPDNSVVCKSDNVKIKCGKIQSSNKKRSTQSIITVDVDIEVLSKSAQDSVVSKIVSGLSSAVQGIKASSTGEAASLRTMNVDGDTLVLDVVKPIGLVTGVCGNGAVYGVDTKNSKTIGKCVSCVAGKYFDVHQRECIDCPVGTYTETPGRLGCTNCPKGKTTARAGVHNKTDCRAPCSKGSFSLTGLENCGLCGKGYYQPRYFGKQCLKCPGLTTTQIEGATELGQCGMPCQAGTYSVTGVEPCLPCPKGYYQPNVATTKCLACNSPLFTHGEGCTTISQCVDINECSSNPCMNGATCVDETSGYTCKCNPGFFGKNCDFEKNECASTPCFGNSYCVDLVNSYECVCPLGYQGKYCEVKESECSAGKCQNGGKCSNTPDGFACSCAAGFTGLFCERTINECASMPCMNNGLCIDSSNGFRCKCKSGYSGDLCNFNIDDCEKNELCLNDGVCVDGENDFTCSCKAGFAGSRCSINIDECASSPCRNGGTCVDLVNGYKCNCAPTFYGQKCQSRQTDVDFDLEFGRDVQSYSESFLSKDLTAFTISFWMKGRSDDLESGTVLSYAVDVGESFIDNAMVLKDPDSFLLTIMGKEVDTKISVGDGIWHHVAVTWSSSSGSYSTYQDGVKMNEGAGFQIGQKIPSGGIFILGQEQDEVGRNFSMGEAFEGSLSQFNVWNKVLAEREITEMSRFRCAGLLGNQFAWPDFLEKLVEVKRVNKFCSGQTTKFSVWRSSSTPSGTFEKELPTCSNAISAQCMSIGNKNVKGLNLINTVCSPVVGFSCQHSVQGGGKSCPDFKARFECPYAKAIRDCSSSPCLNGATCLETPMSYRCVCPDGFHGKNCQTIDSCHKIKSFAHGIVTQTGNKFHFSCASGYSLSGSVILSCNAGKVSGALPSCFDVNECAVKNGGCSHKCTNTEGSFKCTCNQGFTLSGNSCIDENECKQNNGNCQDICFNYHGGYRCRCRTGFSISADKRSCADLNECTTGNHDCQHVCINSLGSFSCGCHPGYVLGNDRKTCSPKSCPAISSPLHGTVLAANSFYGTSASYTCNKGYKLVGPAVRKCARNGKWSGNVPVCQAVVCHPLGSVTNGAFTKTGDAFGSSYTFTCSSGHVLIGDNQRKCQQNGDWSGKMPRCVPYNCKALIPPTNGRIVGESLITGSSVLIYCNKGYMLPKGAKNYRTCLASGSWSGSETSCIAITCPTPQGIANGSISMTGNNYGSKITYTCNLGYGTSGPNERVCQENGEWIGDVPKCLWRSCGYPGIPTNGIITGRDYSYGKKVSYSCSNGFLLLGESERLCLSSGRWTGSLPACQEITCGNPGTPRNGLKHGDEYKLGKSVSFDCSAGFSLSGSISRKCGQAGKWDGTQPKCISGVCGSQNLVGPSGAISSRNYPNGYGLNEYCRWAISVKTNKKATITIKNLKTEKQVDRLEIRDGADGKLISALSGLLNQPITYTSASNKLDVKFVSDGRQVAAAEGFDASYQAASCGGHITSIGESFQSPNYPSKYPNGITCVWQIVIYEPIELNFNYFNTLNNQDKLEVWSSLTNLDASNWIGEYYGSKGNLLRVQSGTGMMYVKFSTDAYHASYGFKATVRKVVIPVGK